MARIRSLKPEFHTDEDIAELPFETRLAFQGLWNHSDRDGKFEWRPNYLQMQIFPPYSKINAKVKMECQLDLLLKQKTRSGKPFIVRYQVGDKVYGKILEWWHQKPHPNEPQSVIPNPTDDDLAKGYQWYKADNHCNKQDTGNRDGKGDSGKGNGGVGPSMLLEAWNKCTKGSKLPQVRELGKIRQDKCTSRLSERPLGEWEKVFSRMAKSPFLNGKNKSEWIASFDWILANEGNAIKVLEGNYDGAGEISKQSEEDRKRQQRERWKADGLSVCHGSAVEVLDDQLRHCVSCLEVQP